MSIIYDALKKLDREKSSRHGRIINIAAEILRPDSPSTGRRVSLYIAAVLFTAAVTVAVTYAVLSKWSFSGTKPSPSAPVNLAAAGPVIPSPPSDSIALTQSSPPPANQPASSDLPRQEKTSPGTPNPKPQDHTPIKKIISPPVENMGGNRKTDRSDIPEEKGMVPEKTKTPSENIPAGPAAAPSSLNISAVVWYEEPSKRFAMINGNIVREGAFVEGMRVEEIFPNRVRFLNDGQHVDIPVQ